MEMLGTSPSSRLSDTRPTRVSLRGGEARRQLFAGLERVLDREIQPTAENVASAAGVSVRTLFRSFGRVQHLLLAFEIRQRARHAYEVARPRRGAEIEEKVDLLARVCSRRHEPMSAIRQALRPYEHSFAELRSYREHRRRLAALRLACGFGSELARLPLDQRADTISMLRALTSWAHWSELRWGERTSTWAARRVLRAELDAVLRGLDQRRDLLAFDSGSVPASL